MIDFTRWRPSVLCIETSAFTGEEELRARQRLHLAGDACLEPLDLSPEGFVRNDHVGQC